MKLEISLLGTFRLQQEGSPVSAFESDKVRALLAYLAVEGDRPHRRETLAGLFWPDVPEARARRSLSQALYNLRSVLVDRNNLPPLLLITAQTLQFNPDAGAWVDVNAFNHLLEESERHAHSRVETCDPCLKTLAAAVDLYRGNFLKALSLPDSLGFEEWALSQRERLRLKALAMLGCLARAYELRGAYIEALDYARRYVELEAFDEEGHQQVMRLLALMGKRNAALRQYETCRLILEGELGVSPNRKTAALAEMIRGGKPVEGFGASARGSLPATLTPFVGRALELAEIRALLADPGCRLVTLLGPGGSGKTRLALEAARKLSYHFRDGVHLVPLSAIASVEGLIPAIAAGVGFTFQGGSEIGLQLRDYLRGRQLLLVLDSFEMVAAGAEQVAELLRAAPQVKALVTSRVRLNLKGEQVYPVEGMRHPGIGADADLDEHSAVALFVEAAQRVDPEFELTADNRAPVGEICRLLEGMPLGVLLATIWIDTYSLEEIAGEIRRNLDFLNVGWVDIPERQRSLRATFEYSWGLLAERERVLVSGLGVFQGQISRAAAEAVVGASRLELLRLVDKTMLGVVETGQFQMHDLIRQYALEKLAEALEIEAAVRERHSSYYCKLAEGWREALKSARQAGTLAEMDGEIENLRAGWLWAVEQGHLSRTWEALEGLCLYFDLQFRFAEGIKVCAQALEMLPDSDQRMGLAAAVQAGLLVWQARFLRIRGKVGLAGEVLVVGEASLEQSGWLDDRTRQVQALAYLERGSLQNVLHERLASVQFSADLFRELREYFWLAQTLFILAELNNRRGDFAAAEGASLEAVERCRLLGEPRELARALESLGTQQLFVGQIRNTTAAIQEAAALNRSLNDFNSRALGTYRLGLLHGWIGRFREAYLFLEEGLEFFRRSGNQFKQCFSLLGLGICYSHLGEADLARVRLEEGLALAIEGEYRREQAGILLFLCHVALLEGDFVHALSMAQESVAIYRQIAYINELVVALSILAIAQCQLGYLDEACNSVVEALQIGVETGGYITGIFGLPAAALLLARRGRGVRAAVVLAQALQEPFVGNSLWYPVVLGEPLMAAGRQRLAEMGPALEDQERMRRMITTAATLLEEQAG